MKRERKIVFLGFFPGFGGAEKSMIMIANGLAKLGNSVTIISLKDNNIVYEIDKKINYIFIPDHRGTKIRKQFNRFLNLKSKLVEIKPNLVISFWLQPAIFAAILSKFIGFKTIYSERGDPTDKEYSGILGLLRYVFLKFVDGFVFQTEGAKKCFSKSIQTRGTIISNSVCIKYDDYNIPPERRKIIVNVGRLHEQKNQKLLINAFAKITKLFPEYTLNIYGDGELKGELEAQIRELNIDNRVQLKGTTNKLFDEIVDASLFVLSSDYEGMPNALLEAMALGIPSISTDCKPGGAREILVNGENGLLVERNSVNELARAIQFMLSHPDEAEKMGIEAKRICNTHSVDSIYAMWEEYTAKIMRGSRE
jgi:glycosyltransferase involved in cell wall biosynthesis